MSQEVCSYCGEKGHSLHECPKWKERRQPAAYTPSTTISERETRALELMSSALGLVYSDSANNVLEAAMYSAKATVKDPSLRRVFVQDFASSLQRKGLRTGTYILWGEERINSFIKHGYEFMEA